MRNYFNEIGFSKEVPELILDCAIHSWAKFNISIRPATSNEYIVISTANTDKYIQFELLTGIDLYSVKFDGDLEIRRANKKLTHKDVIPVDAAMYIFAEMISRIDNYRRIGNITGKFATSKFYGKIPVFLVGWLADLVCWKDKSYTLSEANFGEAFKLTTKETTVVIRFVVDGVKYRLFYDIDNDYEEIILRSNGRKIDVVDTDLANLLVIKLSECFKKMVDNAEEAGIICNA